MSNIETAAPSATASLDTNTLEAAERFIADTYLPREGDTLVLAQDVKAGTIVAVDNVVDYDSESFFEVTDVIEVEEVRVHGETIVLLGANRDNSGGVILPLNRYTVVLVQG